MPLLGTCKHCGLAFKPITKYGRVCEPCKEKNNIIGYAKQKISYNNHKAENNRIKELLNG